MKCTIVGVKKSKTKNGKECFRYYATKEFTEYDQEFAECIGCDVVSEFSYRDYGLCLGDLVDFRYEPGFEGKAKLMDIVMVTPNPVKSSK